MLWQPASVILQYLCYIVCVSEANKYRLQSVSLCEFMNAARDDTLSLSPPLSSLSPRGILYLAVAVSAIELQCSFSRGDSCAAE